MNRTIFRRRVLTLLGSSLPLTLAMAEAIPVEIIETEGHQMLLRDGEPYFIRGVGGDSKLDLLKEIGGNSIRTWGGATEALLDQAHRAGLSVCLGLWVVHERHGFDYSNDAAVEEQIRQLCAVIDQFKDHPAVLIWGIGNEVELQSENPRVWEVVEAVAAYAKKVDPDHPTMTVVAQNRHAMETVRKLCPSIDILGCNSYGGINNLAKEIRSSGWRKPYIVTEWGTDGSWEVDKTKWGAEVELTSSGKAAQWSARHKLLTADREMCLGGYAFFWGSKQETTPTWFGMFIDDHRTELVDALQNAWTGSYPETRVPRIKKFRLNRRKAGSNLKLKPGACARAEFELRDTPAPAEDLRIVWEIVPESPEKGIGGDPESQPDPILLNVVQQEEGHLEFKAPEDPGPYRLFLYIYAPDDSVATANIPFLVK